MRNEIVVELDDSPSSKANLQWAAEQAKAQAQNVQDPTKRPVSRVEGPQPGTPDLGMIVRCRQWSG
jgi:hypothetical protein